MNKNFFCMIFYPSNLKKSDFFRRSNELYILDVSKTNKIIINLLKKVPGICNLSKSELTHIWAFFFGKSGASKFMASSRRNSGGLLGAKKK